tara:strand:- start:131 stop:472 length:342 start_codon:yes stop_codon:yes gene_type:complete
MGELIIYLFALIGFYTIGHNLTTMLLNKLFKGVWIVGRNAKLRARIEHLESAMTEAMQVMINEEEVGQSNIENSFKNGVGIGVCLANPNASDEFITECQNVSWRENQKEEPSA